MTWTQNEQFAEQHQFIAQKCCSSLSLQNGSNSYYFPVIILLINLASTTCLSLRRTSTSTHILKDAPVPARCSSHFSIWILYEARLRLWQMASDLSKQPKMRNKIWCMHFSVISVPVFVRLPAGRKSILKKHSQQLRPTVEQTMK